jgi:hypothetical protein
VLWVVVSVAVGTLYVYVLAPLLLSSVSSEVQGGVLAGILLVSAVSVRYLLSRRR